MTTDREHQQFESLAGDGRPSTIREFLGYLRESKKWWMLPILITMLCLGLLMLLSSSPVAPFIYTLF